MADSIIKAKYDTETITITALTGVTPDAYNRCIRSGNVCIFSLSAEMSLTTSWTKMFAVPQDVCPYREIFFPLTDAARNHVGLGHISADGIYCIGTSTNYKVRGFVTWIIGM